MTASSRPIALLTDFGLEDWYVGALKGRILGRVPGAQIVDLSHAVPPGRVRAGAFLLHCALEAMPPGTVFCCVVDPGVGTARRALCGRAGGWFFAGPDNGLLSPLVWRAGGDCAFYEIQAAAFRAEACSATFHGRDLFAPAAAALAAGLDPALAGPPVRDPVLFPPFAPAVTAAGLEGPILWIDRFGNLVTGIARADWEAPLTQQPFVIRAGADAARSLEIRALTVTYGHAAPGAPLAYWGSAGTLEIAFNGASAAQATGLRLDDPIRVQWE